MIEKVVNLTVRSRKGAPLLELEWRHGRTRILRVAERFASSVGRWLDGGILEWEGPQGDKVPRVTAASSADFLPRVRRYLKSQFKSLDVELATRFEVDLATRFESEPSLAKQLVRLGSAVASNTKASGRTVAPTQAAPVVSPSISVA